MCRLLVSSRLGPLAIGAAVAAGAGAGTPGGKYEALFKTPWNGESGLVHLEHVNVNIPRHDPAKRFYFHFLGFSPDTRRAQNIGKGSGTMWANMGTTQIHLPEGDPQVVPGTIGLIYDPSDLTEVFSRLRGAKDETGLDRSGEVTVNALEGTKFAWRESGSEEGKDDAAAATTLEVTCPYGNVFNLHTRTSVMSALDPRGGRLPNTPSAEHRPLGLGIGYLSLRVKPGTSGGIARFYREIFDSEVEEIGDGSGGRDRSCPTAEEGETGAGTSWHANEGAAKGAVVRVGPVQYLAFMEGEEALPEEYDGHHICVYLTEEGFRRSFILAEKRGLVFVNPRRNFGKADTLEKALEEKQFRIKNMVDPSSGDLLHVLEHEVRSVTHPSYPVGRDLSAE